MNRERAFISKGWEHSVYMSRIPGWVLKKKTGKMNCILSTLSGVTTGDIRDEYLKAQVLADEIGIKVPKTRVFEFRGKSSYVVGQEYIHGDNSVDIKQYIETNNLKQKMHGFDVRSKNFISSEGEVYWIDPNRGFLRYRIMDVAYKVKNFLERKLALFARNLYSNSKL